MPSRTRRASFVKKTIRSALGALGVILVYLATLHAYATHSAASESTEEALRTPATTVVIPILPASK